MRNLITLLFALALTAPGGAALAAAAVAEGHYQSLLADARDDPRTVDWQALRFAYAGSAEFDLSGSKTDEARKAMFRALNAEDDAGAVIQAQHIINEDFVDIDAHVVSNLAYQHLGDTASAEREHAIVLGLLRSIRTGDGSSPASAYTVISVGEEYQVMRAFGFEVKSQALVREAGHSYDKLDVVDADGHARSLYFLVDRVLAADAAMLGAGR